jgi:hypothetical protein
MRTAERLDQRRDGVAVLNDKYFPTAMAHYGGSRAVRITYASDVKDLRRDADLLRQRGGGLLSAPELSGKNRGYT